MFTMCGFCLLCVVVDCYFWLLAVVCYVLVLCVVWGCVLFVVCCLLVGVVCRLLCVG